MEGLELIAFEIISNVGTAKSLAVEALRDAREGKYEEAEEKLAEASKYFVNGHHAHASLIQKEASGDKVEPSLIIMHAEDQMMNCETMKIVATEMVEQYRTIAALKQMVEESKGETR